MLDIFGDDSADETQQRTFAVAAVLGSDAVWEGLEIKWKERTRGLPFHATDCESDRGDFAATSHRENKALYKDLTAILAESGAWGWGAALDLGAYRELFVVDQEAGYYKAFLAVISFFNDLAASHFNEKIKFTFDRRMRSYYNTGALYDLMAKNGEHSFLHNEILFASSRESVRLQVADLMAFEVMKDLDNRIGPVKRERRKSFVALSETGHFGADHFMREYFEDMAKRLAMLEARDPAFNRAEYARWLIERELPDSQNNRIKFLLWFSQRDRRS